MQLKIVTWQGQEAASEAVSDLAVPAEGGVWLSAFYPRQTSVPVAQRQRPPPAKAEYKWWPDGYEPMYYVITAQVRVRPEETLRDTVEAHRHVSWRTSLAFCNPTIAITWHASCS